MPTSKLLSCSSYLIYQAHLAGSEPPLTSSPPHLQLLACSTNSQYQQFPDCGEGGVHACHTTTPINSSLFPFNNTDHNGNLAETVIFQYFAERFTLIT